MLRPPPKDERDFLAGAVNNWCISYDNLSGMQPWLSDALCRLLTGGAFAARTLYSTTEETTIPLARPAILNGIDDLASRPDLADRVITINLQPIKDHARIDERELWRQFDNNKGKVFGVLLDGLSAALKNIDNVELPYRPRMIDAASWSTAAEEGLGIPSGSFLESYRVNQRDMVAISLEASPFIAALLDMARDKKEWAGTPTELLSLLPSYARDEEAVKSKAWPKSAAWTTKILRRHAPALRKIGVGVEQSRDSTSSHIKIIMQVEHENLTPHSQDLENKTEADSPKGDVQYADSTYTTYIPTQNRGPNVSNVGKNHELSVKPETIHNQGNLFTESEI